MTGEHPLARIVRELERAGIEHMLAGSFASTYHGEPRTTADIDLVIDPNREALDLFVRQADPASIYVSREAIDEAWRRRGQFNVVLLDSGWKVDLILRKERAFSEQEFARRKLAEIAGVRVFVATAEDTIVAKLEWARAGIGAADPRRRGHASDARQRARPRLRGTLGRAARARGRLGADEESRGTLNVARSEALDQSLKNRARSSSRRRASW